MAILNLLQLFRSRFSRHPVEPPDGAYEPKIFRQILRRERARADRNAHVFSVIMFDVENASRRNALSRRLVGELKKRTRFTDVIGCLDERRIGVLLPETTTGGATKFVGDIRRSLNAGDASLHYAVHTYPPETESDSGREDPRQLWLANLDGDADHSGQPPALTDSAARSVADSRALLPFHDLVHLTVAPLPWWKRAIDVTGAVAALVLLSPLLLAVALVIKAVSPGPVLYSQRRIGFMGKMFDCWKFRTMHANADSSVHEQHVQQLIPDDTPLMKLDADDPRIIPFGRFLRATGIDELPQLLNVISGHMSLIGPRPDVAYAVQRYDRWNTRRFDTVPGLTGLWQVSGKNRTTHTEMMRLDIRYAQKPSLLSDLAIFVKTVPAILAETRDHLLKRKVNRQRPIPDVQPKRFL